MRLTVISGAPPHQHEAVGDFAWLLACRLADDASVTVIAPAAAASQSPNGDRRAPDGNGAVTLHSIAPGWGPAAIDDVSRLIDRLRPDLLLAHFAPTLYGWRGLKPFFALAVRRLGRRVPIVTVAHEFFAPVGRSLRTSAYGYGHRLLFQAMVAGSRKLVVTTPYVLKELQERFPARAGDIACIPVSATIPVAALTDAERRAVRAELDVADDEVMISAFAPELEASTVAIARLFRIGLGAAPRARLVALGRYGAPFRAAVSDPAMLSRLIVRGPIDDEGAARMLAASDLYVVMPLDGASSRRTSLMAGLANGVPTIAADGVLTDRGLRESGAVYLVRGMREADELAGIRRLFVDAAAREALARAGRAYYDRYFSWDVVARQYTAVLREALQT